MTILQDLLSGVSQGILTGVLASKVFISLVNNGQLSPLFTFTRASSQTYIDSDGLLKEVGTDVPAIDYSQGFAALSLWEGSTNLLLRSQEFENVAWESSTSSLATVTANDDVAPDGTTTADRLTDGSLVLVLERQQGSFNVATSTSYCLSFFLKKQTGAPIFNCNLKFRGGTTKNIQLKIDPSNGNVLQHGDADVVSGVEYEVNGYYRVYLVGSSGDNTSCFVTLQPAYSSTLVGAADVTLTGFNHAWGVQIEQKPYPTPYIPTVASTASRAAPRVASTGANFSSFYNQAEGTFFIDYLVAAQKTSSQIIYNARNSLPGFGRIFNELFASGNLVVGYMEDGGGFDSIGSITSHPIGSRVKSAYGYKVNDNAFAFTGRTTLTDTTKTPPTSNQIFIGSADGSIFHSNMYIASLRYYPKRLTNAELENLVA